MPLENVTGTRLVARVDYADPDRETNEDGIMRTMAGIAFLAGEKSQVIFNVQRTSFQDPLTDPRTAGFVHWDLRF